jgi:hypothetical protein
LNVAGNRAMTWMIGFRLNENSNLRCGLSMLANKRLAMAATHAMGEGMTFNGPNGTLKANHAVWSDFCNTFVNDNGVGGGFSEFTIVQVESR